MTDVFIRKMRGRFLRQKEDTWKCRQRCKLRCHKARTARGQQQLEEARKNLLLDLWRLCGPAYSLIWTFSLQNNKRINYCCLSHCSVRFSRSVLSDSLRPHESQHARPPCPSPTPGVHSDSCPLSRWCHPAISSSVVPFSSCPQSLPASESFPMSHWVYGYFLRQS